MWLGVDWLDAQNVFYGLINVHIICCQKALQRLSFWVFQWWFYKRQDKDKYMGFLNIYETADMFGTWILSLLKYLHPLRRLLEVVWNCHSVTSTLTGNKFSLLQVMLKDMYGKSISDTYLSGYWRDRKLKQRTFYQSINNLTDMVIYLKA